jgi:hypothetical protein
LKNLFVSGFINYRDLIQNISLSIIASAPSYFFLSRVVNVEVSS